MLAENDRWFLPTTSCGWIFKDTIEITPILGYPISKYEAPGHEYVTFGNPGLVI